MGKQPITNAITNNKNGYAAKSALILFLVKMKIIMLVE